jgi:hypothetical protein
MFKVCAAKEFQAILFGCQQADMNDLFPSHWRFRLYGEKHSIPSGLRTHVYRYGLNEMKSRRFFFGYQTMNFTDLCAVKIVPGHLILLK